MAKHITVRFWANVEKSDGCWEWRGGRQKSGYGHITHEGRSQGAHRVSYLLNVGQIPEGYDIDHLCHNRACVNPTHLRAATRKQNMENRSVGQPNSKAGVRGVTWSEKTQKWLARVGHNGKKLNLGFYDTIEEAAAVAKAKRQELFEVSN